MKYKFINVLIIIFLIISFNNTYCRTKIDISDLHFFDIKNNKVEINIKDTNTIYIFYEGVSCKSCYVELVKGLKLLNANLKINCILEQYEGVFYRKESIKYIQSIVKFDNYIFVDPKDNNIFKKYKINSSPSLMYYNIKNFEYITFEEIFQNSKFKSSDDFKILENLMYF